MQSQNAILVISPVDLFSVASALMGSYIMMLGSQVPSESRMAGFTERFARTELLTQGIARVTFT